MPSGMYKELTIDEIKSNIPELATIVESVDTQEMHSIDIPLPVGTTVYRGKFLNVVPGISEWYNVKYDVFNLLEDYRKESLELIYNNEGILDVYSVYRTFHQRSRVVWVSIVFMCKHLIFMF